MLDIKDPELIRNYTRQYGWSMRKGAKYLAAVLTRYVENGCTATKADYSRFVKEAAAEFDIRPASFRAVIERYVRAGWEDNHPLTWEWEHYAGWHEPTPPNTTEAIKLVCEAYVPFVTKYEDAIRHQRGYYLHMAIEELETQDGKPNI